MKSLIRLVPTVLCGLTLAACAGTRSHPAPRPVADVSAAQFSDIPVPDGMRLKQDRHESHSFEVGDFRYGDFHYYGRVPKHEVADYMTRRMGLHGWELAAPAESAADRVELRFRRRPHMATCEIWQDTAETHMKIAVRTEVPD